MAEGRKRNLVKILRSRNVWGWSQVQKVTWICDVTIRICTKRSTYRPVNVQAVISFHLMSACAYRCGYVIPKAAPVSEHEYFTSHMNYQLYCGKRHDRYKYGPIQVQDRKPTYIYSWYSTFLGCECHTRWVYVWMKLMRPKYMYFTATMISRGDKDDQKEL